MKYLNININDYSDLKKFYRNLNTYKRFYNKRIMKLNINKAIKIDDKEELLMCESAFNIKDKNKRLEYVYDTLCDYHDRLYLDTNICEFDKDGLCLHQREGKMIIKKNGCCGSCSYLGRDGCTIKCLACKNHFCSFIKKRKNIKNHRKLKLYKYFLTLPQKEIADVNYWTEKEDSLKIMKKNSFIANFTSKESKMKRW